MSSEQSGKDTGKDMEALFLMPKVHSLLQKLIGFDETKVFGMGRTVSTKTNEYRFMTDNELQLVLSAIKILTNLVFNDSI